MSNVVKFYPNGSAENPDNVLEQAIGVYEDVIILGYDKDGALDCRASLGLSHEQILWITTCFQHKLLAGDYSEEGE